MILWSVRMELIGLLAKVVGMVVAMMGSGFVLGYVTAKKRYQQDAWDKEFLVRHLTKELEDGRK